MGHLTDHEASLIRDAVLRRRTPKTFVEGKWSVSPLNQDPIVVGAAGPKRVVLRDITLRTIEQTPGVWITQAQRRYLAEALIQAGVSSVHIAWLAVEHSSDLKAEVSFLKALNPKTEVSVIGGTSERVNVAADAGADLYLAYGPIVPEFHTIHGPYARQIHRAHRRGEEWRRTIAYPKTEAEHLKRLQDDVAYAKQRGLGAGMFTSMLHYATTQELINFARAANEVGADEIGLGDGASGVGPEAWRFIVSLVRKEAPRARVSLHTHNAFGLATASALAGIQAGAEMVEVAVNHLCSGAGQADLAEVAASLDLHGRGDLRGRGIRAGPQGRQPGHLREPGSLRPGTVQRSQRRMDPPVETRRARPATVGWPDGGPVATIEGDHGDAATDADRRGPPGPGR